MTTKANCIYIVDENENRQCKASQGSGSEYCVLHDPDTVKCKGMTKDKKPCMSLPMKEGDGHCHNHTKNRDRPDKIKCGAPTKKKTPCTIAVAVEGQHCKAHGGPGKTTSKKKKDDKDLLSLLVLINNIFESDIKDVTIDSYEILKAHLFCSKTNQSKELKRMKKEHDMKMIGLFRCINNIFNNFVPDDDIDADSYETFRQRLIMEKKSQMMDQQLDESNENKDVKMQF